jgi:hypothetical protein
MIQGNQLLLHIDQHISTTMPVLFDMVAVERNKRIELVAVTTLKQVCCLSSLLQALHFS